MEESKSELSWSGMDWTGLDRIERKSRSWHGSKRGQNGREQREKRRRGGGGLVWCGVVWCGGDSKPGRRLMQVG